MSKYFSVFEQRLNSVTEKYTTLAEQEFSTPQRTYNVLSKKTEPYTAKDLRDLGTAAIAGVIISDEVAKKAQDDWVAHVVPEIRNRYPQIEIAGRSEWSMTAHMPNVIAKAATSSNACDGKAKYDGFNDYFASNIGLMGCSIRYPNNKSLVKLVNQVRKFFGLEELRTNPYDQNLKAKVKQFQIDNGIKADGDYGIETHSVTQNVDIPDLNLKVPYETLRRALGKAKNEEMAFNIALSEITNSDVSWLDVAEDILPDLQEGLNKQFEIFDGLFKTYYDAADNLGVEPINPFAAFNPGTGPTNPVLAKLSWNDWKKVYDLVKSEKVKSNDPNFTSLEKAVVQTFPNDKELENYVRGDSEQIRSADPLRAYIRDVLRPQINQTLPYLDQLVPLANGIAEYQAKYEKNQATLAALRAARAAARKLAHYKKQAELAQERFDQRDLDIANRVAAARGAEEQDLYGPDDDAPLSQGEQGARDQDLYGDPEVGPMGGTGVGRSDDRGGYLEMARREFDKALANTKGPTRGDGALETARRAYDTAIANTPGPTRGNYGARLEMSRRAYLQAVKNTLDTGRGSGFKEMARRAFDIAIANTTGPTRGGGYLEVARREFDKALANTPGPTRGSGYLEMARRAFDIAIANTPDTGRGDGFKEMARRAYDEALKNTQGPTRGDGALETMRRAFDTALKNTLDTGRGSGEYEVDRRRFVDNVRDDIDQWMNRNRAPGETTGGFVAVSTPGDESDRPTGEEQIEAQQELHRKIVNMFDDDRGQARASYILRLVRELNSFDSKLLDPESREKYINNLKQTYVKYKAQEDFLRSQDGNPTLYYGFNPGNLNSVEGVRGRSNFNLSDTILYSLELLTQVVPNAIQKHSPDQSVIDANPPVELDKDDLNQQAQARTAKLDQAAQELRDQGAARSAAGEEELANRDEIRARAEETAEQERERRRIIADQLKSFKEIEAETTNKEAAFDAVIEPLDALISNVEADVTGTQIDSLANLQTLLDAEYNEKAEIISNAITGKDEFEELDERLYNVVVEKLKQFNEKTNTVLNELKAVAEGEDANISTNEIFGIDTAGMRADIDAFSTLKDMPNNFVSVATSRIDQIDSLVDTLQRRYNFYNDEFMVLHREVNEVMLSSWDNIDNFEYDELVDLYEDVEELFELSQATGRSNREQQIVDNKYSTIETNIGKLIRRKARDFGKRAVGVYNDIVTKTRIDALDIVEGDLVLTPEAFDELYNRRDEVDGLIEEFETIQEFLETVNTEEPEFFTKVQPWLDTLVGFYQTIEQYAAGRSGPNRRGSPSDAYRYYKEILGKVREPARAGFAGRGAPSPEAREALKGRNLLRFWQNGKGPDGLPVSNSEGDTSESSRKKQHRSDIISLANKQGREAILQLLAKRRAWQLLTGNFVDNPHQDTFIEITRQGMRRVQDKFNKGEIKDLDSARKAIAYLDKLKDQYYG